MVGNIPDDILVSKIFMRLPASRIVALRSVCRSWHRLTTDPSFVRAHTRIRRDAVSTESIVFQHCKTAMADGDLQMSKLDVRDVDRRLFIRSFEIKTIPGTGPIFRSRASCDGLLCFQSEGEDEPKPYHICNPVTRTWTTVSANTRGMGCRNRRGYLCGFYFRRSTGEYRLLHYASHNVYSEGLARLEGAYEVATIGGEDKSWRTVREFCLVYDYFAAAKDHELTTLLATNGFSHYDSILINGRLHWLELYITDEMRVTAFDTESEEFSRMSVPIGPHPHKGRRSKFQINEIRGKLCFGRISEDRYLEETMELWLLKDYATQQWVELQTIHSPDRGGFTRTVREVHEEDGELLVRWNVFNFTHYNFKLKTYDQMKIMDRYADALTHDLRYTESLVDPRVILA